jgi:hypothetical protein
MALRVDPTYVPKIPLPCSPQTLVELMTPHLKQIALYAAFRCKAADIERAAREGASRDALQTMLTAAWQPIPEYDTWIGNFGQIEQRLQRQTVYALAGALHLAIRDPEPLRAVEADRMLQTMRASQRSAAAPVLFGPGSLNFGLWPEEQVLDRLKKLKDDGLVEPAEGGNCRLADWQAYVDPRVGRPAAPPGAGVPGAGGSRAGKR